MSHDPALLIQLLLLGDFVSKPIARYLAVAAIQGHDPIRIMDDRGLWHLGGDTTRASFMRALQADLTLP